MFEIGKTIQNARILMVDDQEANRRLLEGILRRAGYVNLTDTGDPRQVLDLCRQTRPDLVLLDLMMPHLDGFTVIEQINSLRASDICIPIIVLTADTSSASRQRALTAGAKDFVTKPIDSIELLIRVRNLLETYFLQLELQNQNQILQVRVRKRTADLARMMDQLISSEEDERRRLAMDIHDGPLQSLGVSIMALNRAIHRHERLEHDLVEQELLFLRTALADATSELRGVLANLSLDVLTKYGLERALTRHLERLADLTGIHTSLNYTVEQRLPARIELLLYRLAQEAIANIRKHAHAKNMRLSLTTEGAYLCMVISDDGQGFDANIVLQQHPEGEKIGLRSMQERIQDADGEFKIESSVGSGTTLRFRCPLPVELHATDQGALAGQDLLPGSPEVETRRHDIVAPHEDHIQPPTPVLPLKSLPSVRNGSPNLNGDTPPGSYPSLERLAHEQGK